MHQPVRHSVLKFNTHAINSVITSTSLHFTPYVGHVHIRPGACIPDKDRRQTALYRTEQSEHPKFEYLLGELRGRSVATHFYFV